MKELPGNPLHGGGPGAVAQRVPASVGLLVAAVLYTVFVGYGCLVPLEFQAVSWADAWTRYQPVAAFHLGPFSKTDVTANILLFIPLAFLWAGVVGAGWRRPGAVVRSAAVALGAVALQALLEYLQIFTPNRNVSTWDVLAGGIGAAIGVVAWCVVGSRTRRALDRWKFLRGGEGVAGWLLAPYTLFVLLWNVLPLDLTLDASALYTKWSRGLILPIPFTALGADPIAAMSGLIGESLLWLPIAGLLVLSGRSSRFVAWCATLLLAVCVEALQLLIQSRVTDTTDLISAGAGAAAGAIIGHRLRRRRSGHVDDHPDEGVARAVWVSVLASALWSIVLAVGFLYPFDFQYVPGQISSRLAGLVAVPFRTYWLATEARAVSDLFLQLVLFAPFGVAAAAAIARRGARTARWFAGIGATVVATGIAALLEGAQVFLPAKVPDSTDIVLAAAGALLGFAGTRRIWRAVAARPTPSAATPPSPRDAARPALGGSASAKLGWFLLAYGALLAVAAMAATAPGVPYNVRELFGRGGLLAVLAFPVAATALFAPPVWIALRTARGGWLRAAAGTAWVAAHGIAMLAVLRAGVPLESIHDVVGSPILGWPGDLEVALRFLALFATISALYVCGALLSFALAGYEPLRFRRALPRWLAAAAPLLLIGHVVVVLLAATDNLTELMAGGGTIGASLCLALVVVGFAAATTALAGVVRRRLRVWIGAALLVTGLVIGWVFLTWGMADEITKYGRTFSALQFLLSPDRDHYTPSSELFTRYVLAFVSMIVVGALAQAPFMGRRGNRPADAVAPAIPPKT